MSPIPLLLTKVHIPLIFLHHRMSISLAKIAVEVSSPVRRPSSSETPTVASFEGWFLYWSFLFILPLFSEFFLPKTVYPCKVASDEDHPLHYSDG